MNVCRTNNNSNNNNGEVKYEMGLARSTHSKRIFLWENRKEKGNHKELEVSGTVVL
jgi:hypothetical protein